MPPAKPILILGLSHCCPSMNTINIKTADTDEVRTDEELISDQVIIPEVKLTWYHTLIEKCSFDLFCAVYLWQNVN